MRKLVFILIAFFATVTLIRALDVISKDVPAKSIEQISDEVVQNETLDLPQ